MKIILLKEVQGLGHTGDIKEVSDGYGRNFLIPKGLAVMASGENLAVIKTQKDREKKSKKLEVKNKKSALKKINGKTFTTKAKADETGTLYAKIDARAIAAELNKAVKEKGALDKGPASSAGRGAGDFAPFNKGGQGDFSANEIKLAEPIKKIGEYEVGLMMGGESGKIIVRVIRN